MNIKTLFTTQSKKGMMRPHCVMNNDVDLMEASPYTPEQIRNAYTFPKNHCAQQTIAIINAYGSPTILEDVAVFGERFQLPPATIEIVYPQGKPQAYDIDWAIETSLDVQWAYALAPSAKILLVIAKDNSDENLFGAVTYAVSRGAKIVSMSWGSEEYVEQLMYDKVFKVPGVAFVSASGDTGDSKCYPSTSPYVLSAGGSSLQLTPTGNRIAPEIAWYGSGGGISKYEPKQSWQCIQNNAQPKTNKRTIPDVAFFSDPYPGVYVYVTIPSLNQSFWFGVGGTSFATVCWASIFAYVPKSILVQAHIPAVLYKLAGETTYTNPYGVYYDTKNGNNGYYPCIAGYDYVTGLGTPHVSNLLQAFQYESL